ncbi:MAG TPA: AMP-binding protein, partial [Chitinophagaceae bacterium]|nr:AMP-binding protein [Chitinophagaceae bacterium]
HQEVPFEKVVEAVVKSRQGNINPLFQVVFILQNLPAIPEIKFGDISPEEKDMAEGMSHYELVFNVSEEQPGLQLNVGFNTNIFDQITIERLVSHYCQLLASITANASACISKLRMLQDVEVSELLNLGGVGKMAGKAFSLTGMLKARFENANDDIAVTSSGRWLSYKDVLSKTNAVSQFLYASGLRKGDRVVVLLDRSEWMVIVLLALFKNGLVYVPVDKEQPMERINSILEQVNASMVLTDEIISQKIMHLQAAEHGWTEVSAADEAYIIYTSGSTGKPKGVVVTHGNLAHYFGNIYHEYIAGSEPVTLAFTASNAFDISFFQVLVPLLSAGCCIVADRSQLLDMSKLASILQNVTAIDSVPAVYDLLTDQLIKYHGNADL